MPVSNQNMVEMGKKLLQAASENDVDNVRLLMSGGAPFTGNWLGTTPLHAAAKAGHSETVELLLNAGIFRDAKTKVDRTALQMAAEEGHTDIVQMLINHGADVNTKDMLKMTALHWAVQHSHTDTASLLLQHSADVTAINKFGKSPLDIACDNNSESIFQLVQAAIDGASTKASAIESETATEKLVNELAAEKRAGWKPSPEDVLEKLTSCTSESTSTEAVKLLESHGISFLPVDDSTLLTSALESGQSLSLTAGKMALKQTKSVVPAVARASSIQQPAVKRFKLASGPVKSSPRVVTITAEQFLALAGRLQQQGKSNKPMVISLPKQFVLPAQNGKTSSCSVKPANNNIKTVTNTVNKKQQQQQQGPLVKSLSQLYGSNKSIGDSPTKSVANPIKPTINVLNLPDIGDMVGSSPPCSPVKIDNCDEIDPLSTPLLPLSPTTVKVDEVKTHFFKSGLLKGSARTTPITLLCRNKAKAPPPPPPPPPALNLNLNHSTSPSMNNVLSLDHCSDLFNEESDSGHAGNPPVWLSIMEEENSQFTSTANDEDLLDPARLAAQLASIRQAASQYSFSS